MYRLALLSVFAVLASSQSTQAPAKPGTFSGPAQAKRGYELFFDATKTQPCGVCHLMQGRGTAVGPDLAKIARLPARGFVIAILSTRTQYAVSVKPKEGEKFSAMKVKEDDQAIELYDLSKTPPELRKLAKAEIEAITDNAAWKHPPESAGYSKDQLADVIAYIKWVGYKSKSPVKPDEL